MSKRLCIAIFYNILIIVFGGFIKNKCPTIFIIGDSTVKNGKITNGQKIVGWGELLQDYFDTSKINIVNAAIPGRSSRTYTTEGHFDSILDRSNSGDFLFIQFGHNDGGNVRDSVKPRGSLEGIGDDSTLVYNVLLKRNEYVHTYGWYLKRMVMLAKEKGVNPIIVSPIPRHIFTEGKVQKADKDYGRWGKEIAEKEHVPFLDLNAKISVIYDSLGFDKTGIFFPNDHTHTNRQGAIINAEQVIKCIQSQENLTLLRVYLNKQHEYF